MNRPTVDKIIDELNEVEIMNGKFPPVINGGSRNGGESSMYQLEEVAAKTGEEDEDVLLDMAARLYIFDERDDWKEQGLVTVKLLKHKERGMVRLVLRRRDRTLKTWADQLVVSTTKTLDFAGSNKTCVWHAAEELFAIEFGSVNNCKMFRGLVAEIAESHTKNGGEESKYGSSTAGLQGEVPRKNQLALARRQKPRQRQQFSPFVEEVPAGDEI